VNQYRPVTQESVTAYEVGTKISALDRKLQLNAALFYYDYKDKQIKGAVIANPDIFGPLEALVNVPKSSIKGAEVQIDIAPVQGLRATLAGTYIDSKIKGSFINYTPYGALQQFAGEAFPYTPKWNLSADIGYEFPVNDRLDFNIGGNVSYRSKTNAALGAQQLFAIDGYTLVDLRAGIAAHDGSWTASVFVRNLGDTYYWNNTAKILDTTVRYAGAPRTFGVNVAYRFGS